MKNPWKTMQWLLKDNMDSRSKNLLTYDKDTSLVTEGKAVGMLFWISGKVLIPFLTTSLWKRCPAHS